VAELIPGSVPCPFCRVHVRQTCARARARAGEHATFSPLSLSGRRRDLQHVAAALGLNLRMHIQDTNVLNPGWITPPGRARVGTLRASEGDGRGGGTGGDKDGLFYYFSYRQERKGEGEEGGREGGRKAESTTGTTGDGGARRDGVAGRRVRD